MAEHADPTSRQLIATAPSGIGADDADESLQPDEDIDANSGGRPRFKRPISAIAVGTVVIAASTASGYSLTDPDTTSPDVEAARENNKGLAEVDDDNAADDETVETPPSKRRLRPPAVPHRQALLVGLPLIAVLLTIAGWLGWQLYETHRIANEHAQLLQVGRQGALNLTTIDWQHAEADVQRILDSATGTFYDDFSKRSQPFVDVVKQAQSKSEGTVTASGLESASANEGQVLVALSVNVSNAGAPEQHPRSWRMRISVQKVGGDMKVSNVEFIA